MYGAMLGDYVGSIYEWHNIKTKEFRLFHPRCHLTDDSYMTMAVAQACNNWPEHKDLAAFQEDVKFEMIRIGLTYPNKGYGGGFRRWLGSRHPEPYGSYGNGSAMRVSPCGLAADTLEEAEALAEASALPTHNHPEGVKGAKATAAAIFLAKTGHTIPEIEAYIKEHYYPLGQTLDEIRPGYTFNESCQGTVPQAIQAFLESTSFEDAIRNAISLGGDSDTLAAITGGIAEAYYGVPERFCVRMNLVVSKSCFREESDIITRFRRRYAKVSTEETATHKASSGHYCDSGCPFGGEAATCIRSLHPQTCPIEQMYRELTELRKGGARCSYCSKTKSDPEHFYPANACGSCGRFCPACAAPKE